MPELSLSELVRSTLAADEHALCPSNEALMATSDFERAYTKAQAELVVEGVREDGEPFEQVGRAMVSQAQAEAAAPRLNADADDYAYLQETLPQLVLMVLAEARAEAEARGEEIGDWVRIDFGDGSESFAVFADDGAELRDAATELLLAERHHMKALRGIDYDPAEGTPLEGTPDDVA